MAFLVILVTLIAILCIWKLNQSQRRLVGIPPGPRRWPIVGNFLNAGLVPYKTFIELGKQYGPVFSFDFGCYPAVVINDLKLIKEVLNNSATAGRPELPFFVQRTGGPNPKFSRGIITSNGHLWKEQRRFFLRNLKDFGFGKATMESIIIDDVKVLLESIAPLVGKVICPKGLFNTAVLNSIWRIVGGGYERDNDGKIVKLLELVFQLVKDTSFVVIFYPLLAKWFPNITGYNSALEHVQPLYDFMKESYEEHKQTLTPGYPRDLIDTVVEELESVTDPTSTFHGDDGELNALKSLVDIFVASAETTSTSLEWICLLMILNPEAQEKMFHEISSVIGGKRQPVLADRPDLPYTESLILESLRIVSVFPMTIPHNTIECTTISGYTIPPDTLVIPNVYAVHHSQKIWGDPEVFRPERLILPDGTANRSHEALLPFGYGKRVCIGEKLALDELFLFTSSVFQKYRVEANPVGPKATLVAKPRFVLYPEPFELIFHPRSV